MIDACYSRTLYAFSDRFLGRSDGKVEDTKLAKKRMFVNCWNLGFRMQRVVIASWTTQTMSWRRYHVVYGMPLHFLA